MEPSTDIPAFGHWVDGHDLRTAGRERRVSTSPVTGRHVASIELGTAADVDAAVRSAAAAAPAWRALTPMERGRLMLALATRMREQSE